MSNNMARYHYRLTGSAPDNPDFERYRRIEKYFPALYRKDLRLLRSAELYELQNTTQSLIARINDEKAALTQVDLEIKELGAEFDCFWKEVEQLQKERNESMGFLQKLFNLDKTESQIEIDRKIAEVSKRHEPLKKRSEKLMGRKKRSVFYDRDRELLEWYLTKLVPFYEKQKDLEDTWIDLRNRAASNSSQIREVAGIVKERIEKQDYCPYCGGDLGESPHADHIYPVSKGGRSTIKNMVYVCASCNMSMLDMTLSTFIRVNNLNREEIEARLTSLGKEF